MKKLSTALILLLASFSVAMATEYNGKLKVTINGASTYQDDVFTVNDNGDGTYTFLLKNFILSAGGNDMPVGNIEIANVNGTKQGDVTVINVSQGITITQGDDPAYKPSEWMGPMLSMGSGGSIPIELTAEINEYGLYAHIDIDMMSTMKQVIEVTFSSGYQIKNSGFEAFHVASVTNPSDETETVTSDEPDNWHSFMSSTSNGMPLPVLTWMAVNTPHTFISNDVRPGSDGQSSLLLTSSSILGIIANGTVTTGRINAGSPIAADAKNNSYSDITMTDVDANGDQFYSKLNARPDSLIAWVKFKQTTPSEEYPYATIKAVVTDGTYFQDPEDKEYTNVLARAVNNTIESNGFVWQRLAIPFEYTANASTLTPKVIHVTASTNATPGKGSIDSLFIDDMSLVYNCGVSEVKVKGVSVPNFSEGQYEYNVKVAYTSLTADDVVVTATGAGTIVEKSIENTESGATVTIKATSNDMLEIKTYTVNVEKDKTNGITPDTVIESEIKDIYTIEGIKVTEMLPGNIYIVKYSDGKIKKVIKK